MSKIKIETLTNVHIGSGNMLYLNNDYCETLDSENYPVIGILDPRKMLNLIGVEHINDWLLAIERDRPVTSLIRQYAPKAVVEDYTSRLIDYVKTDKPPKTLKEAIHDGLGRPYIPGSSLKGAIRTAVLASMMAGRTPSLKNNAGRLLGGKNFESRIFGDSPNTDVFRFLQVGDVFFDDWNTGAMTMVNINEREKSSFWDDSKKQLIETIGAECDSAFEIKIKKSHDPAISIPECMKSVPVLFETINNHTRNLLESEIAHWEEKKDSDSSETVDAYIKECSNILSEVKSCKAGKSCVLRVGHGSGWRFITGAWTEGSSDFQAVRNVARPGEMKKYHQYDFPKSRRVSKDCAFLGFVKFTIL